MMLDLPQTPKERLPILYGLWTLQTDKKFAPVMAWIKSEWERLARSAMFSEGPALHRQQGAEIALDKIIEYATNASDDIDRWEKFLREPPPG
jgi:hypothetical protein